MLEFNSTSLRYKFIYLTKNVYHGIAVHTLFTDAFQASSLNLPGDGIYFYMIDKYVNFIPFSLRFEHVFQQRMHTFEPDVILPTKRLDSKWITFTNILFFVDMYNPERTSFLYISRDDSLAKIETKMNAFLQHCAAVVENDKKMQSAAFMFSLREQLIVFHMLAGRTIKQIAQLLHVTDKMIYKERDQLTRKLEMQQEPFLFNRLAQRGKTQLLETPL